MTTATTTTTTLGLFFYRTVYFFSGTVIPVSKLSVFFYYHFGSYYYQLPSPPTSYFTGAKMREFWLCNFVRAARKGCPRKQRDAMLTTILPAAPPTGGSPPDESKIAIFNSAELYVPNSAKFSAQIAPQMFSAENPAKFLWKIGPNFWPIFGTKPPTLVLIAALTCVAGADWGTRCAPPNEEEEALLAPLVLLSTTLRIPTPRSIIISLSLVAVKSSPDSLSSE
ncbi:hypothetical protein Fcan01_21077 [Folsomia candida]|uniref:Uncharacterized protein n=1 Tax=Folsomia candida TaxID=158441 RepID=A0A226DFG6_FOLCA|nr:hypothetical protein Fcan01_21077 [Folsomia candida]